MEKKLSVVLKIKWSSFEISKHSFIIGSDTQDCGTLNRFHKCAQISRLEIFPQ